MGGSEKFSAKELVLGRIKEEGGWVNAHAHIDRAGILNQGNLHLTTASLQEKWDFPDRYKADATVGDIYSNMAWVVEDMIRQRVGALCSFIDVDPVIQDKAISAAQRLRQNYGSDIDLRFANQVVKGVIDPDARRWFELGAEFADFVGGLPEKDKGHEAEHLDILFETAKMNGGKGIHVHIDQFGLPSQRDTELLVRKTIEHDYQGKVVAVHAVSIAAQPKAYRQELYAQMKDAGITVITCPMAYIASRRTEIMAPMHNFIAPVEEMLDAGLTVAIGTDNIQDLYMPFADGDMWTELRALAEACYIRDLDRLVKIATLSGRKVLGLSMAKEESLAIAV